MSAVMRSSPATFPFPAASEKRLASTPTRASPITPAAGVNTAV